MDKSDKWFVSGTVAVILGNLLGFILILGMVWADFESYVFPTGLVGERTARTLDCPILMTGDESRQITLTLSNPEDRERSRFAEGMVIEGDITHIRKMNRKVSIKPGGKEVVAWAIYPEDAVYGRLVLFRVYVKQTHSTPSLEGTCGVLVLDIPILTGRQVMGVLLGLTLTLILSGNAVLLFLYVKDFLGSWHRYLSREMGAMSLFTLLGIWAAYVGNGTFGFIFLLTAFFMLSHLSLRSLLNRVFGSRDA